jgi:hypothetical protein
MANVRLPYASHSPPSLTTTNTVHLVLCRYVLYDVVTNEPLVLHDAASGLSSKELKDFCNAFRFLHNDYIYRMNRTTVGESGHSCGAQRMEMLLLHNRMLHSHDGGRTIQEGHRVSNTAGQLDAYVAHVDESRFSCNALMPHVAAMEERMMQLMPELSACRMSLMREADVTGRLYSEFAKGFLTTRGLIPNMGLSDSYASPCHCDDRDVAWCVAFSGKCVGNALTRYP